MKKLVSMVKKINVITMEPHSETFLQIAVADILNWQISGVVLMGCRTK